MQQHETTAKSSRRLGSSAEAALQPSSPSPSSARAVPVQPHVRVGQMGITADEACPVASPKRNAFVDITALTFMLDCT